MGRRPWSITIFLENALMLCGDAKNTEEDSAAWGIWFRFLIFLFGMAVSFLERDIERWVNARDKTRRNAMYILL